MTKFTADNTEGFTAQELNVLNRAREAICNKHGSDEQFSKSVSDILNNVWIEGASVEYLVAKAETWAGL